MTFPDLTVFAPLLGMIASAIGGKMPSPGEVALEAVRIGLSFVPTDELRGYLDDEAKRRQDAFFEFSKDEKFGRTPP